MRLHNWMLCALLVLSPGVMAQEVDDPVAAAAGLQQRLAALDATPELAAYERLLAGQAVAALAASRRREAGDALYLAERRVSIAEAAARTGQVRREIERFERTRHELLVEAGQRDLARARAENERLRLELRIQTEEATRLREQVEEETQARAEVEAALEKVSSREASRLRAARQRAAELARQEAELLKSLESPDNP